VREGHLSIAEGDHSIACTTHHETIPNNTTKSHVQHSAQEDKDSEPLMGSSSVGYRVRFSQKIKKMKIMIHTYT
jgi:hypothetical protein